MTMIVEMDRILRELARPVRKETWLPMKVVRGTQICASCWETIYPGPAKGGAIAAWKCVERNVYECDPCRQQAKS